MTDHERAAALLLDALDRPPETRRAWLAGAVADDALRAHVLALLDAHEAAEAGGPLDTPLLVRSDRREGLRVGPWKLVEPLGEGGMGTVWKAERADGTYDRSVALKLLRVDGATDMLAERLRAERQILARLEHPNIARLYDGGMADDGRPYLVLERVDGQPITAYADAHDLDVPARLRLFLQVCEAVAYAHRNLVVHRDLKPSNVFVADDGTVKLLDFGIAKLVEEEQPDELTRSQLALTPSYAAPEQIRRAAVTTATDVYALGVMLYELLGGQRPFTLTSLTAAEAERLICDTDAPPPSTVAPPNRAKAVRGDLDTIVAKAMDKDPARRYASADALAADVRRRLDGLPVLARPATRSYRMRRFVARHRVGVAAAAAVGTALVAGLGATAWQAQKARAEADKASAANAFLVEMLAAANPDDDGRDVRVATLLDRAAHALDTAFAGTPETEAALRKTLGWTYRGLGLYAEADTQLTRALAIRTRLFGPRHPDVAEVQESLGRLYIERGEYAKADSILGLALATDRDRLGPHHTRTSNVLNDLGQVAYDTGDYAKAVTYWQEGYDIDAATKPEGDNDRLIGMANLALALYDSGDEPAGTRMLEEQVALLRRHHPADDLRLANSLANLGSFYYAAGARDSAAVLQREAVERFRRALGDDHPSVAFGMNNLGSTLGALGQTDEAERMLREAVRIYGTAFGTNYADHPDLGYPLVNLAKTLNRPGRRADAEADARRAVQVFTHAFGADNATVARALVPLGQILVDDGRPAEAVPVFRRAAAIRTAQGDAVGIAIAESLLGDALRRAGNAAEAAPLLRQSHAALVRTSGPDDPQTKAAADRLALLPR